MAEHMKLGRKFSTLTLVLCCLPSLAADQYYRHFLEYFGTNLTKLVAATSPILVDTNNVSLKVTNSVFDLKQLYEWGELSGVRPGMRMEEVVSIWGKPHTLWSRCFGGPRFCYRDVSVFFDPSSNSVIGILPGKIFPFSGLSTSPNLTQTVSVLGEARFRWDRTNHGLCDILYESSQSRLHLTFREDTLSNIKVERLYPGVTTAENDADIIQKLIRKEPRFDSIKVVIGLLNFGPDVLINGRLKSEEDWADLERVVQQTNPSVRTLLFSQIGESAATKSMEFGPGSLPPN